MEKTNKVYWNKLQIIPVTRNRQGFELQDDADKSSKLGKDIKKLNEGYFAMSDSTKKYLKSQGYNICDVLFTTGVYCMKNFPPVDTWGKGKNSLEVVPSSKYYYEMTRTKICDFFYDARWNRYDDAKFALALADPDLRIHETTSYGGTVLHEAVSFGLIDPVKRIIKVKGIDLSPDGIHKKIIRYIGSNGSTKDKVEILKLLMSLGFDVNVKGDYEKTLLHDLVGSQTHDNQELIKVLLSNPKVDCMATDYEGNIAIQGVSDDHGNHMAALKLMVKRKEFNVNHQNKRGETILHKYSFWKYSCMDLFDFVLQNCDDIDLSIRDNQGKLPEHINWYISNKEKLDKLVEGKNIKPDAKKRKKRG